MNAIAWEGLKMEKSVLLVWKNSIGNDISRVIPESQLDDKIDELKRKGFQEIMYRKHGDPKDSWKKV